MDVGQALEVWSHGPSIPDAVQVHLQIHGEISRSVGPHSLHLYDMIHRLDAGVSSAKGKRDHAAMLAPPRIVLSFAATSRHSRSARWSMSISAAVAMRYSSRTGSNVRT